MGVGRVAERADHLLRRRVLDVHPRGTHLLDRSTTSATNARCSKNSTSTTDTWWQPGLDNKRVRTSTRRWWPAGILLRHPGARGVDMLPIIYGITGAELNDALRASVELRPGTWTGAHLADQERPDPTRYMVDHPVLNWTGRVPRWAAGAI